MSAFLNYCRVVRRSAVRVGEDVRLVRLDGCMAHVRGVVLPGKVICVEAKRVYGDSQSRPWATIRTAEGTREIPAEINEWSRASDGVMEHSY